MAEPAKELKGKKASEVFLEYCKPLLDDLLDGDQEEFIYLEKSMRVPWMIWNAIVMDQAQRDNIALMGSIMIQARRFPNGDKLIEFWKRRKTEAFNDYQYLMGDFKIVPTAKGAFTLQMESRCA